MVVTWLIVAFLCSMWCAVCGHTDTRLMGWYSHMTSVSTYDLHDGSSATSRSCRLLCIHMLNKNVLFPSIQNWRHGENNYIFTLWFMYYYACKSVNPSDLHSWFNISCSPCTTAAAGHQLIRAWYFSPPLVSFKLINTIVIMVKPPVNLVTLRIWENVINLRRFRMSSL